MAEPLSASGLQRIPSLAGLLPQKGSDTRPKRQLQKGQRMKVEVQWWSLLVGMSLSLSAALAADNGGSGSGGNPSGSADGGSGAVEGGGGDAGGNGGDPGGPADPGAIGGSENAGHGNAWSADQQGGGDQWKQQLSYRYSFGAERESAKAERDLPAEVRNALAEMKKVREQYQSERRQLRQKLQGMSAQDRDLLRERLKEHLEEQSLQREQLRERLREMREALKSHEDLIEQARERVAERARRGD